MAKSRHWSNASAPCRLEWRPSRWLAAALAALGGLAAFALVASGLPLLASIPLAALAAVHGLRQARRQLGRHVHALVIPPNDAAATVDGHGVDGLEVHWRGPLAFLQWRQADGRVRRLQGWPDSLDAAARRELRLAMAARTAARPPRSMAP